MPFPLKNDAPTAKPAFPTQSPAGNAPALGGPPSPSITGAPSPDMGAMMGGAPPVAAGAADPVQLITEIQTLLDQLVELVAGPVEPEPEFEPQSDEEVMAGLAPKQKGPPLA